MFRFITPIILIAIAVTTFFAFTNPLYNSTDPLSPGIVTLKAQVASYNEALGNSKALENERDKLTAKYNSINPDNLIKLQKLLPESIDNIRLILEIEKIASPYGMVLKDVKYDTIEKTTTATAPAVIAVQGGGTSSLNNGTQPKDYGVWNLAFSISGTYSDFLNFTRNLEDNLRIVDISSISFSSNTATDTKSSTSSEVYKYDFKIKTYWLKK